MPRLRTSERRGCYLSNFHLQPTYFSSHTRPKVSSHPRILSITPFDDYTPEIQFAVIINEHRTHAPPNDLDTNSQLLHRTIGPSLICVQRSVSFRKAAQLSYVVRRVILSSRQPCWLRRSTALLPQPCRCSTTSDVATALLSVR